MIFYDENYKEYIFNIICETLFLFNLTKKTQQIQYSFVITPN